MIWTEVDRTAIRSVVEAQLQAFQQDDAEAAFEFASPGIQELFRTPTNFLQMVRQSYQPVYRPRSVMFEELTLLQDLPTQPVLLLSPDGDPVRALYLMENRTTGSWRITGCYLLPVNERSTY
ncbi:DUF4864 domain-containing protein [filamentous cyanobacterium LEGE 11480]|uniref:DUF4864 domain-containing protein n=2 Tax=Romeriopsis TaxID=2992131 RepID=A0A928Z1V9_9CYAN|nr:DUF4864 domain-containing protein [Romeriopsis navalis LEGE 11480]